MLSYAKRYVCEYVLRKPYPCINPSSIDLQPSITSGIRTMCSKYGKIQMYQLLKAKIQLIFTIYMVPLPSRPMHCLSTSSQLAHSSRPIHLLRYSSLRLRRSTLGATKLTEPKEYDGRENASKSHQANLNDKLETDSFSQLDLLTPPAT